MGLLREFFAKKRVEGDVTADVALETEGESPATAPFTADVPPEPAPAADEPPSLHQAVLRGLR